ncbi:MAG: ABC transporter ATP-binding protein [Crocinitomicaceae bacterium]|nr:ABC transporter ATP-binding protein [Crocinitomicaceae bacterium]
MKSLSYLNKYFIKYKWRILLGVVFIFGTYYFKAQMPLFFGEVVDDFETWNASPKHESAFMYAINSAAYYMLLALIAGVFLFLTRQMIIVVSRYIEYDLKNEIYQHYQKLGFNFYKKNSTGDLMNRISEDVTKVRMYLGPGVLYSLNLLVMSILIIYQMVAINGYLTFFVLLPLPVMSLIIYKVASRINKLSTTVQEEQSFMSTLVQETFSGIRVVKAYSRTEEVSERFSKSAENYKAKSMKLVMTNALFMPTIFILIGISTILCIYLGGLLFYDEVITKGQIITFIIYVNMLTWPFASIGWVASLTQRAAASQERINEFLNEAPDIVNTVDTPFSFEGKIEFRNVTFTYPNSGIMAVSNLSFILNKGESLGIVGKTGSGKSTILNLLMRQVEPDQGTVLIDDVDIRDINLSDLRKQTGIVPQDVFLFSDTIKNNLRFGALDDVDKEKMIEVTKAAHVYHNIEEFKDQFETILGERGVNLSGGQKQRLSIARALIRNPKLLILDDCLSAVDTETEEVILSNLKKFKALTSLVVSHRISSIRNASKVIVIEEGSIIEQGTHAELMQLGKEYAELYKKQLAEDDA